MESRKLRPYFQCHPIAVVTAYPLHNILHKHELSGRLAKWDIELSEYEITYQPRTAIKSQVLADFVADFSQGMQLEAEKELQVFNGANLETWTLFTDGSSNVKGAEESKGNWPEMLPGVLWAYRTTAKTSTGETPFSLVYGVEALIPVEIGEPSTRFTQATEESNDKEMHLNLDLLEGRREAALIRMAAQKQVIERYYNRKARLRQNANPY
ncbi:uncharacterized protein [Nicotiana sylvestris]|uniref:uncharacterized protein n=1 Tax=Nicotiana sylvestris TaxID=4096 RepID=UPI00388C9877